MNSKLYTVDDSGYLACVDPQAESIKKLSGQISEDGQWATAKAVTTSRGRLYIRDENGKIYELDPWTKEFREIGTGTWSSKWLIEGGTDQLVSIESNGTVYRINTKTGTFEKASADGEWEGAHAAAGRSGSVFVFGTSGRLFSANLYDGSYTQIGDSEGWAPRFAVMGDYYLYAFESDGSLYEIAVY